MPHRLFLAEPAATELAAMLSAFRAESARLRSDEIRQVPEVLDLLRAHLEESGWALSTGARRKHGLPLKAVTGPAILADGLHRSGRAALWVETGRSWTNNGYLEHLVRPTACQDVDHVVIRSEEHTSELQSLMRISYAV